MRKAFGRALARLGRRLVIGQSREDFGDLLFASVAALHDFVVTLDRVAGGLPAHIAPRVALSFERGVHGPEAMRAKFVESRYEVATCGAWNSGDRMSVEVDVLTYAELVPMQFMTTSIYDDLTSTAGHTLLVLHANPALGDEQAQAVREHQDHELLNRASGPGDSGLEHQADALSDDRIAD